MPNVPFFKVYVDKLYKHKEKQAQKKTNHNYNAQLTHLPLARWISWVHASDNSYRGKMILVPHRPWSPRHQEVDTGHPDPRDSHRVRERNTLSLWLYGRRIGFSLCSKENMQHSGADVYRDQPGCSSAGPWTSASKHSLMQLQRRHILKTSRDFSQRKCARCRMNANTWFTAPDHNYLWRLWPVSVSPFTPLAHSVQRLSATVNELPL